jgi:hypothetical protein
MINEMIGMNFYLLYLLLIKQLTRLLQIDFYVLWLPKVADALY